MAKISAGLLPFRRMENGIEFLLVHPGGPYWVKKDAGFWGIAKGLVEPGEDLRQAAIREFKEETGFDIEGKLIRLTERKQPSGKLVHAWAVEFDCDPALLHSNTFEMEWPPKSGKIKAFPEIDRAQWFDEAGARAKITAGQIGFIDELMRYLDDL